MAIKDFFKKYWITFVIFLAFIALYIYTTEKGIANSYLFPDVKAIKKAFVENKGLLIVNLVSSFKLMIPAIIVSLVIALAIGTVLGLNEKLRDALHPIIYTFSVVPSILLSPFALLLSPSFFIASLFLIVYGTLWSTLFATITGIMTIDKRYLDKAATLELKGFKRFFKVILPAASPSILSGFVNSLRSTFVMLVYAEMYGANNGMGFFVKKYAEFGLYANTWVGFLFMVVVLVIVMQLFEMLKKYLLKWTIN
ncbi:MAG: ABC transporter permease subunit [Clostridioides sp.]|jgi:NitT/TauT family transport system permease protein|nr:ABC transporter permease subunit [Clostridioides sp.]